MVIVVIVVIVVTMMIVVMGNDGRRSDTMPNPCGLSNTTTKTTSFVVVDGLMGHTSQLTMNKNKCTV